MTRCNTFGVYFLLVLQNIVKNTKEGFFSIDTISVSIKLITESIAEHYKEEQETVNH